MYRISIFLLLFVAQITCAANYSITDFGAIADSATDNRIAIQSAINAAYQAGGGRVIVPKGTYVTGTIELKSNVALHLKKNATLLGHPDPDESNYPPVDPGYQSFLTRPDVYPRKVLVYAKDAENVGISGSGTIDGNGMESCRFPAIEDFQTNRLKCINLVRFISCKNVVMHGEGPDDMLKITNSGHWAVQPMNCDGVHLRYVRIEEYGGVTPDGLPIGDCRDVLVEDCYVSSDDDALGLKNGSPHITVENITIKRTVLESANTGFKSGSPQSFGKFRNIQLIDCIFRKTPAEISKHHMGEHHGFFIGILTGGSYEDVLIDNCIVQGTKMPFAMYIGRLNKGYWSQYWEGKDAPEQFGSVKNITIRNLAYKEPGSHGILIEGRKESPIENLTIENVYLPSRGGVQEKPSLPAENEGSYPNMSYTYGKLPAYGFFIRNAKNIQMKNVWAWAEEDDARPCLVTENVSGLDTNGLHQGKIPPQSDPYWEMTK